MTLLTEDQIAEIRKREDLASTCMWITTVTRVPQETPMSPDEKVMTIMGCGPIHHEEPDGVMKAFHDAEFIAHARQDIPALLADRDELMKRIETLEYAIEVLQSIAAEKCKPSFDEQLPKLSRSQLISIVDTDTKIAREALAKIRGSERCEHQVHGTDCFTCHPSIWKPVRLTPPHPMTEGEFVEVIKKAVAGSMDRMLRQMENEDQAKPKDKK